MAIVPLRPRLSLIPRIPLLPVQRILEVVSTAVNDRASSISHSPSILFPMFSSRFSYLSLENESIPEPNNGANLISSKTCSSFSTHLATCSLIDVNDRVK